MTTVSPPPQDPAHLEPTFDQEILDLVTATAPRLFAVVEQFTADDGEPDARVAAWGLAHDDGSAQVASVGGGFRMSLRTPERAAQLVSRRSGSTGSLVWPGVTRGEHSLG
ncbi:hypothetical protein OK074_4886 [Actinobacteria bacterium OK074]|nr:hypothetical protein OK074_4886 [Actinobacteria bacterium OK074]